MRKIFKFATLNIITIIVILLVTESSLRLVLFLSMGKERYEASKYINADISGAYDYLAPKEWQFGNNLGFNSNYDNTVTKDKNRIKLLVIGGSGAGGSKDENWPGMLMDILNEKTRGKTYEVYNCGVAGATSTMELDLLSRLINLNPDIVIIYDGWNDVYFSHYAKDPYVRHNNYIHNKFLDKKVQFKWFLKKNFEICRQLVVIKHKLSMLKERSTGNRSGKTWLATTAPNTDKNITQLTADDAMEVRSKYRMMDSVYKIDHNKPIKDNFSSVYTDNLERMVALCNKNGIKCIIIIQPSLLFTKNIFAQSINISGVKGIKENTPKFEDWRRTVSSLYPILIENAKKVYKKRNCLYADFTDIYVNENDMAEIFTDDVHQTFKGKQIIAQNIYYLLKKCQLVN